MGLLTRLERLERTADAGDGRCPFCPARVIVAVGEPAPEVGPVTCEHGLERQVTCVEVVLVSPDRWRDGPVLEGPDEGGD